TSLRRSPRMPCDDCRTALEQKEREVAQLTRDIEQGFMAGAYARLKNLQACEAENASLKARLAEEQESHNKTLAGWYDPAQFGVLKSRAEKAEAALADLESVYRKECARA